MRKYLIFAIFVVIVGVMIYNSVMDGFGEPAVNSFSKMLEIQ